MCRKIAYRAGSSCDYSPLGQPAQEDPPDVVTFLHENPIPVMILGLWSLFSHKSKIIGTPLCFRPPGRSTASPLD